MKNNKFPVHKKHKTIDIEGKEKIESELFPLTLIKFFSGLKAEVCALFKNQQQINSLEDKVVITLSNTIIKRTT